MAAWINFSSLRRIPMSRNKVKHLHDRLVLVYTGDRHLSANVHDKVFDSKHYKKKINFIDRMKGIAKEMSKYLANENRMSDLIQETWELQKALHPSMSSLVMKRLQVVCKNCYLAARATGAGGGGCMLFYVRPEKKNDLIKQLNYVKKKHRDVKVLPFEFDYKGIVLSRE